MRRSAGLFPLMGWNAVGPKVWRGSVSVQPHAHGAQSDQSAWFELISLAQQKPGQNWQAGTHQRVFVLQRLLAAADKPAGRGGREVQQGCAAD